MVDVVKQVIKMMIIYPLSGEGVGGVRAARRGEEEDNSNSWL